MGSELPPTSSSRHLKLLEPPFRTRIRIRSRGPLPIADLRQIVAVLVDIQLVFDQLVPQPLFGVGANRAEARHTIEYIARQMETVDIVEHRHVEGRRGGP